MAKPAKKAAPKKSAKPAKKAAKPAKPAKAVAKKPAKPVAKKVAKPAKPVVKKAAGKPAKKMAAKPAKAVSLKDKAKGLVSKILKGKPQTGKKEDPKKLKAIQKAQKEKEAKEKKEAAIQAKQKEKQAKIAAKEAAIQAKKQAKVSAKEEKIQAKLALKNKDKNADKNALAAKGATDEKPRRRGDEDLDLFGDDDFAGGDDIEGIDEFDFDEEEAKPRRSSSLSELDSLETRISEEITNLAEHFDWNEIHDAVCSLDYFVDSKSDECMEKSCDNLRTTQGYCRLHYIKNYKTIKRKKEILKEGRLQDYITELIGKYPPKFIEQMLADLTDDREFYKVLNDLGITTNYNYDDVEESAAVEADDDDDLMVETRTIVTARLGYDDEEM